jgi:hypothetical protein
MTSGSMASGPSVAPPRDGRRRTFTEADKRQIVDEAVRPGASLSEVLPAKQDTRCDPVLACPLSHKAWSKKPRSGQ